MAVDGAAVVYKRMHPLKKWLYIILSILWVALFMLAVAIGSLAFHLGLIIALTPPLLLMFYGRRTSLTGWERLWTVLALTWWLGLAALMFVQLPDSDAKMFDSMLQAWAPGLYRSLMVDNWWFLTFWLGGPFAICIVWLVGKWVAGGFRGQPQKPTSD